MRCSRTFVYVPLYEFFANLRNLIFSKQKKMTLCIFPPGFPLDGNKQNNQHERHHHQVGMVGVGVCVLENHISQVSSAQLSNYPPLLPTPNRKMGKPFLISFSIALPPICPFTPYTHLRVVLLISWLKFSALLYSSIPRFSKESDSLETLQSEKEKGEGRSQIKS